MDAVDENGRPVRFSFQFVKLSTGEVISITKGFKVQTKAATELHKSNPDARIAIEKKKKNPGHSANQTRNIQVDGTDQVRKFKIRLMTQFNGRKVFW